MNDTINIKYINDTDVHDCDVIVFTKNFKTRNIKTFYVAWHVLRGQSSVTFQYPVQVSVGATYQARGLKIVSGPFDADMGSSWSIVQNRSNDTAILSKISRQAENPYQIITVDNKQPKAWSGNQFDVGIYKDGRLLIVQNGVHSGDRIVFMLQPKLYFAVVRNFKAGDIFTSIEVMKHLTEFDLLDFPHGLEVTLSKAAGGGRYSFVGENKIIE